MSGTDVSSEVTRSVSGVHARKNAYRKAAGALGIAAGVINLIALPFVYFLLEFSLIISAALMLTGGLLIWYRTTITGAVLVLVGGFFGGFLGLPFLLFEFFTPIFGDWFARLPLVPLGLILPLASFVLALMSLKPFQARASSSP